ncbi:MAG: hypothetical protein O2865_15330 [Planctomycetota bacterium]|nr:hypothetical protein [Planctomycetota bacterium]MDA0933150.1 hypothetical protein [Planctomycetota bacterium]MDA1222729.1 hypothetical protein [Planctomycetota bacterium]
MKQHQELGLTATELAAAHAVVDFDAAETDCPACGTRFATTATRCPDCGLNFG